MMKWGRKHRKGISYKRGYVGFNPSGITAEQIDAREKEYLQELSTLNKKEIQEIRDQINTLKTDWQGSWPWEWCAFSRHYGL